MRFRLLAVVLALGLAACAGTDPARVVYELRADYDAAFLAPAAHYRSLPLCPTAAPVCADPKAIAVLQKVDASAQVALDNAEDVVRNHPGLNADAAIAAAQDAVSAAEKTLAIWGIH